MNIAVTTELKTVGFDSTPEYFELGYFDASLKRMPEYTNYEYMAGYVTYMKEHLATNDRGQVLWSQVLPSAGWSDCDAAMPE